MVNAGPDCYGLLKLSIYGEPSKCTSMDGLNELDNLVAKMVGTQAA